MSKFDKKSLIRLIENLVDKLVESKVERMVEERIQKITPMLVEHEVNRLLKEQTPKQSEPSYLSDDNNSVGNPTDGNGNTMSKGNLREHFKHLIGADRTMSFNSSDVHSVAAGSAPAPTPQIPNTHPDGRYIDTSDPNVQKVANIMNKDYSSMLKSMKNSSKQRGPLK